MTLRPTGMTGDRAAVELAGVRKTYGSMEALRGIDLRIERGDVVAILGPNGAGKTTAVNLMLGLRRATAGKVRLFGLDPMDRRARSQRGAMLQDSGVPSSLSVREVIELFRAYYPAPLTARRAIEMAGLEAQSGTAVGKLSGGQRQRLYYALAVCGDPKALFLDEPTTAMDVAARRSFLAGIAEFGHHGRTVVLTTHDLDEADQLASRVIVIDRGLVVADDPPAAIKARIPGKRVSFRVDPPFDPARLAGLALTGLVTDGTTIRFLSNQPEEVLAALFSRGVHPRELEVAGADLEDAFLALTGASETVQ